MNLLRNSPASSPAATVATVSFSEGERLGAVGAAERRDIPLSAPRGVSYRPCEGDSLLLVPADGRDICAGALVQMEGLAPGELRLASAGGAVIHLKENGDILLNGVTITKNGEILPREGG